MRPPFGTPFPPTRTRRCRVALIDDHPMLRRGLREVIGDWAEFDVCGEAGSLAGALALVEAERPDVVVFDLRLPDDKEMAGVRLMLARHPTARILVFSAHEERFHAMRALDDGACGYLMKGAPPEEIRRALRSVAVGERHVSARLAEQLLCGHEGRLRVAGGSELPPAHRLSLRQREVLHLLGQGLPVDQVAGRLGLSVKTVETHCANMKARLGLQTARDLLCYAASASALG
ncbi:DNA-binding response regulator [Luteitalea sp. TBR-22]|uniref:response regulator transcription factor n=1 Tax=Luteitalea sp. TBR-22 TaxID=2802971 RepID=UPI001EF6D77D|nr:response regulator transcription factor [Luteitalea sp. TBR-22]BCS32576.2 DNA-binding response regulator [Luteitalea sp. TBR-22]